uniref:Leucine-rich repeat and WD repeat-containing protein 1-like n=1 Tax=Sinocyclocheilus rhinocerous TaxID=307959 RepID=A0A673GQT8_9TELE
MFLSTMEKITEQILLEKSSPKTNRLEQIKILNLSRMGLKGEDLPVPLLSKLCSLEQLDLSGNMLQEIPKGLCLPSLKILNCSNNDMEDVVSLEALRNVEELRLEDNLYLTVNDEHKVIFLLPKLRIFNGKDISSTAHHIRHGSTEILRKRVIGVWERSFSLPDPITAQSLAAVEKRFVHAACTQIKYGPNSLSEYTKWRVEMIAKEYLKSLTCSDEEGGKITDTTPTKENEVKPSAGCKCNVASTVVLQEFFSLAWSTVLMSRTGGSARPCNILAAGGKRGLVKLIHPRVNLAFGEFRASRRAISIMRFSPRNASFLFTGTYENKIFLWDIGGLDRDYNFKISKLLVLETCSTPLHLSLLPTSPDAHLLSGCDDGLYIFDIQLSKNTQKRNEEMEIVFPVYKKKDKKNTYRTIDGLSFLSDDIVASKSHMQGSIYLWSWRATRASWNGRKKEVPAVVLAELQWSSTDVPYLSLGTCPGYGYVVCGDEQGRLWMYHITDTMMEKFKSGKTISATEVLEWPSPVRAGMGALEGPSINGIAMDPDLHYLVALTDKNMAVVWKRESR